MVNVILQNTSYLLMNCSGYELGVFTIFEFTKKT